VKGKTKKQEAVTTAQDAKRTKNQAKLDNAMEQPQNRKTHAKIAKLASALGKRFGHNGLMT
jgi:hypothetical protein